METNYNELNKEYQTAVKCAKCVAIIFGIHSENAIRATNEAKRLSEQLKDIDRAVGQCFINVNPYFF